MDNDTRIKYSYAELEKFCDKQLKEMSEKERYQRLKDCDPTFEMYVLSSMKPGDDVCLDEINKSYVISHTTNGDGN